MRHLLISPRISVQKNDFLGSGIPYWPVELATLTAFLQLRGDEVTVLDLFGSNPFQLEERSDHYLQGMHIDEALHTVDPASIDSVIVYALSCMAHSEILAIISKIRSLLAGVPISVLENSQAVTGYALPPLSADFFTSGATALLCGEVYWNWPEIAGCLFLGQPTPANVLLASGAHHGSVVRKIEKTPSLPVPAWELFPLKNYWRLPYSHGPKTRRFLPLLTSRGCPFPCDFCVVPETNDRRWRGRAPQEVVNEILALRDRFGVRDFQIEDLNPTVNSKRTEEIARLLIEQQANIRFYLVSGTKAETIPLESVDLLARAGLRYVSISPESGSSRLMRVIGKPFDYAHGTALVQSLHAHGIYSQACFLVGHPDELESDILLSAGYLRNLVRNGLDEVAVFIVAPVAGSMLFNSKSVEIRPDSIVSFSPQGRADYSIFQRRRRRLIAVFFAEKLRRGLSLWLQGARALIGRPRTKMENLPRRVLFMYTIMLRSRTLQLLKQPGYRTQQLDK